MNNVVLFLLSLFLHKFELQIINISYFNGSQKPNAFFLFRYCRICLDFLLLYVRLYRVNKTEIVWISLYFKTHKCTTMTRDIL